jgi:Protein of unknown function (DUF2628)
MTSIEDDVTIFSVYEPARDVSDVEARADRIAFVKEGFSWPALFVPALWLLFYRMWIELIIFLVLIGGLQWLLGGDRQGADLAGWVTLAISVLFAFEANDLRAAALARRGYRLAAVAVGHDRDEAEEQFFRAWLPQQSRSSSATAQRPTAKRGGDVPAPIAGGEGEEVIGLFPKP